LQDTTQRYQHHGRKAQHLHTAGEPTFGSSPVAETKKGKIEDLWWLPVNINSLNRILSHKTIQFKGFILSCSFIMAITFLRFQSKLGNKQKKIRSSDKKENSPKLHLESLRNYSNDKLEKVGASSD
jgi:hypothetical protein